MTMHAFFPTRVYAAPLQARGSQDFNARLLEEARQLRRDDAAGQRWSAKNYRGGYTSYGSVPRLQTMSPTFDELERKLRRHVMAFAAELEWDLAGRPLHMTDCWVNIMGRRATHGLHLHPVAALSGTYYVKVPQAAPGLKFEDPRLERFMAAPPRRGDAQRDNQSWVTLPAVTGHLVLFESWLRHEVISNMTAERVSVSFNYHWL